MMNLKYSTALLIAFTAMAVFQCSPIESTGGTGTETVNTFARLPDGTPASGATAKIVATLSWIDSISSGSSPILWEGIADEDGRISFDISAEELTAPVNLQIDHEEGALLFPLESDMANLGDTVQLKTTSSLSGTVDISAGVPSRLLLSGSSYETGVDASGIFSFSNVAPGIYTVVTALKTASELYLSNSDSLTLSEDSATTGYEIPPPVNRLLIDNFESGVGPTSLSRIFPLLGWYVLSDSIYYLWNPTNKRWERGISGVIGNSPIYYDSIVTEGNTAFSVSTVLDRVSLMANALFGFSLKPVSDQGANLSTITSISLRASGKGVLRLRFESLGLDTVNSRLSHYTYPFVLADTMGTYTIPVDSLRILEPINDSASYPWEQESRNVLRIEFEFSTSENDRGDSLYCTIDDFYFNGVTISDLTAE
ncbi:MAG: hypothetical protein JW863_11795 [Chitinispirillaceae bacterium]|nr:hypothetical protein [Chitinispirillaceae bacterium]